MNVETVARLIVMVCEAIKQRSGGSGLETRIADRVLAEVTAALPGSTRPTRRLPGGNRRRLPSGTRSSSTVGGGAPPAPDDDRPWLEAFLAEAEEKRWCIRRPCTTCGAQVFRRELMVRAARAAGLRLPPHLVRRPEALAQRLGPDDIGRCCVAIAEALARLPRPKFGEFNMAAASFILDDLREMMWPSIGLLRPVLAGSWAGEFLELDEEEQVARRERAKENRRREEAEQEAAAERAAEREMEAQAHRDRKAQREPRRRAFLAGLAELRPARLFERLLDDDLELPIDAVPAEMIPLDTPTLSGLDPSVRARLVEKIGNRRGVWDELKKRLQSIAATREGA